MEISDIQLRPATPADIRELGELGALLVAQHHAFDPRRFIAPGPDAARGYGDFLVGELAKPDVVVLTAADAEDRVVGYAYGALEGMDWLALRGPAGVIYDLVVDPAARAHGVGRRLVEGLIARLEALGAPQVVLFSATQNAAAQRLFERVGFRRTMVEMTRERGGG
ncbi:GNAT family N-acetyltransferase [Phenylobacterium sp. J426]|uniref:GNAT family N-acetyltransferase n=1 Tax=Phenylobacterium sp. J426 TaxID=2898439 RepID=UPI002151EDA6|nr:GNAT family N-acetyltransferase [Phenylobacterium sp. J426]MCR5873261.1 GNAT family N-acetyltransferase [Phenylobacterium sp. J426]